MLSCAFSFYIVLVFTQFKWARHTLIAQYRQGKIMELFARVTITRNIFDKYTCNFYHSFFLLSFRSFLQRGNSKKISSVLTVITYLYFYYFLSFPSAFSFIILRYSYFFPVFSSNIIFTFSLLYIFLTWYSLVLFYFSPFLYSLFITYSFIFHQLGEFHIFKSQYIFHHFMELFFPVTVLPPRARTIKLKPFRIAL